MNIREAILRAADHISGDHGSFDFRKTTIPCGTPGCALGWIGSFAGFTGHIATSGLIRWFNKQTGIYDAGEFDGGGEFYARMDALCGSEQWKWGAALCASTLRLYADKYHHETRALIPASVRAIFEMTPAELARELA